SFVVVFAGLPVVLRGDPIGDLQRFFDAGRRDVDPLAAVEKREHDPVGLVPVDRAPPLKYEARPLGAADEYDAAVVVREYPAEVGGGPVLALLVELREDGADAL